MPRLLLCLLFAACVFFSAVPSSFAFVLGQGLQSPHNLLHEALRPAFPLMEGRYTSKENNAFHLIRTGDAYTLVRTDTSFATAEVWQLRLFQLADVPGDDYILQVRPLSSGESPAEVAKGFNYMLATLNRKYKEVTLTIPPPQASKGEAPENVVTKPENTLAVLRQLLKQKGGAQAIAWDKLTPANP